METIEISNFKGYKDQVEFVLDKKNLLLFGENGAGKSSLFEALKFFYFFNSKIEPSLAPASATTEDRTQRINDYKSQYNNSRSKTPFSVKVNSESKDSFRRRDYNVFLISPEELKTRSELLLTHYFSNLFFDGNPSSVLSEIWEELASSVTSILHDFFKEKISVRIEKADSYRCVLVDENSTISYGKELTVFFNESRLHLIQLLLLLEVILLSYDKDKQNIIVLDDFVTSLDAANRAFIIEFLLKHFKKFQIVVLTHSVGFYDLFKYEANTYDNNGWLYWCVYSNNESCYCYKDGQDLPVITVNSLSDSDPVALNNAGNQIRRSFEILVHRLCRHLIIGGKEEAYQLLSQINSGDHYYRNGEDGADRILDSIASIVNNKYYPDNVVREKIKNTLTSSQHDLSMLQQTLKRMQLFQKVALHPSSHDRGSTTPILKKELLESVYILTQLNGYVKELDNHSHVESLF